MRNMRFKYTTSILFFSIVVIVWFKKESCKQTLFQMDRCTQCKSKSPCSYVDEVDLRVIVMTYNRLDSLKKCLAALQDADIMGAEAALEIWIDISKYGMVDVNVLRYAESFKWRHGRTCVHVQTEHSSSGHQWIYSWRPRPGSKEIGVFIEDDVDVSKYFFRFLRGARDFYSHNKEIVGISLYDEHSMISSGPKSKQQLERPKDISDIVFLYGMICTYGYAPFPEHWRAYQDWYHNNVSRIPNFDPTAKEVAVHSRWFKAFQRHGRAETMQHSMYFMRYIIDHKLYTLHPNLQVIQPRPHSLTTHRKEKGLHYSGKDALHTDYNLRVWKNDFVIFPRQPKKYNWAGDLE